ncbi:MAG: DUF4097 family beta strand repeat protein [Acidobacteria bacterium]|nr:DUF4097 family beta strand repeat protein [Acidobacteriota bacterium]
MLSTRVLPAALACASLVSVIPGCVVHVDSGGFSARKEQRFTVDGRPTVDLSTFDGPVEVQAWDRPEVLVRIETRASSKALLESIDVDLTQDGSRIVVDVTAPDRQGWSMQTGHISRSARVVALVPVDSELKVRSDDGSVSIERVRGLIDARTGDGRIVMRRVAGDITADSGDGSVQMEEVDGDCTVSTRDGSVLLSGRLRGGLRATSGDGSITVKASSGSEVSSDWAIETADGSVTLGLPEDIAAVLDARTEDGRIALHGFPEVAVKKDGNARSMRGAVGGGTRLVHIRTGDGSITVKRLTLPGPPEPP